MKTIGTCFDASPTQIATAWAIAESVGEAVRNAGIPREDIFVITKLYPSQFSNSETAIEEALAKPDIGYIDMMLLHHPGAGDVDAYLAMEQAVEDGKIRSPGLSNWYVEELEGFLPQVNITPALVRNEIHPYYQENDVVPYIHDLGIVVQGWYPLGGVVLQIRCTSSMQIRCA
ncbi:aldo/keto reductase [Lachnospiraceae bacterium 47-T17]